MRPMNTKAILGISLAASFAVSMIFAQNAMANGGDHKDVTGFDVEPFKNTIVMPVLRTFSFTASQSMIKRRVNGHL